MAPAFRTLDLADRAVLHGAAITPPMMGIGAELSGLYRGPVLRTMECAPVDSDAGNMPEGRRGEALIWRAAVAISFVAVVALMFVKPVHAAAPDGKRSSIVADVRQSGHAADHEGRERQ